MQAPIPTPIYRLIHVDNLHVCIRRGGLHASNYMPDDGLTYKTIHNLDIQNVRRSRPIPCGADGVIHDYVSFYFGYLSPMMLQLKTGRVEDYDEGQEQLIYLISTAQTVERSGKNFVFSNGHGIAAYTQWYDDLTELNKVDWDMVCQRYWADNVDDMDRQRRKQAEFLVHEFCDWSLIESIAVVNEQMETKVGNIMNQFSPDKRRDVHTKTKWYY